MMQRVFLSSLFFILILTGCSSSSGPDASYTKLGTVEHRTLSVQEGGGSALGGTIGSVMGALLGNDRLTSSLGVIAGGVAGSHVGKEMSRYDSSELSISLDEGDRMIVNTKDLSIQTGDRVKVIKEANQFPKVEKIAY